MELEEIFNKVKEQLGESYPLISNEVLELQMRENNWIEQEEKWKKDFEAKKEYAEMLQNVNNQMMVKFGGPAENENNAKIGAQYSANGNPMSTTDVLLEAYK